MAKRKKSKPQFSKEKLGAVGTHSRGKMHKDDEGDIKMALGHTDEGKVVIDFGTPVVWIGMDPDEADGMADLLRRHASQARIALKVAQQNRKMN